MDKDKKPSKNASKEALEYPGIAENIADKDKVDKKLVKDETKELNNNPRNNGKII